MHYRLPWACTFFLGFVAIMFKYASSTALDGTEDGALNERLASAPEAQKSLQDEALGIVFGTDSETSFYGF